MKDHIPSGYHSVNPYLIVQDAKKILAFLREALRNGRLLKVEVCIGDSAIFLAQITGYFLPRQAALYLYVPDVELYYFRALAAGATSLHAPTDMFFDDRMAVVSDAEGNEWWIAERKATYTSKQLSRLAEKQADVKRFGR